jgi:hypothetical protein
MAMTTLSDKQNGIDGINGKTPSLRVRKKNARDEITGVLLEILTLRNILAEGRQGYMSPDHWHQLQGHLTSKITEAQNKLERLLIVKYRLDHLEHTERIYGIPKRRRKTEGGGK